MRLIVLLLALIVMGPIVDRAGPVFSEDRTPPNEDPIRVERGKEKNVYIIGKGKERDRESEDKERAWQMLDQIIIDRRDNHEKRPSNSR